jgi:hypothetical protein
MSPTFSVDRNGGGVNRAALNIGMTPTSPFKNNHYYDPFYDTLRAFVRGEVTLEEVQKADAESRQAEDQNYALLRRLEDGLRNPETSSQVRDLLLQVPLPTPPKPFDKP